MSEQLKFTNDGQIKGDHEHKVELAIQRLQAFEPQDEPYWLAFSGGKDSQCIYHLCKMAGVKFEAVYAITSVDTPELLYFIREHYPDVKWTHQYWNDGKPEHYYPNGKPKPITMWNLISSHTLPPTRKVRYCCAALKEPGGGGRVVVTGVRWAESNNRKKTHGVVDLQGKPKTTINLANRLGADYKLNKHGEVIMNDDNDANRRMLEQCFRTNKRMVNPIVDWTDDDVWQFLNENNIPHCCLYDPPYNYTRLGCIGCPLAGTKQMLRGFELYPKYKEMYIRAFQRMIENHPGEIRILDPNSDTKFKLIDDVCDVNAEGAQGAEQSRAEQSVLQQSDRSDALVSVRMDDLKQKPVSDSSSITATPTNDDIYIYIYQDSSRKMVRQLAPILQLTGCSEKPCLGDGSKPIIANDKLRDITSDEILKTWLDGAHDGRWPWWIEVTKWE